MRWCVSIVAIMAMAGSRPRFVPAEDGPLISELLASNATGLTDEDGDPSDWIELWNPGPSAVSLAGWSLTDDASRPRKWTFPAVDLPAGAYLVVFASGKDRFDPARPLHTSFRLSSDPEYLALVRPDGSWGDRFAPAYPRQREDVSYGIADSGPGISLIAAGSVGRAHVPPGPSDDPLAWTLPGFDDSGWIAGPMGFGFDARPGGLPPPGERVNLAPAGAASQSSEYGGFPAERANDGDYGNFTATSASDASPTWEVDLGRSAPIALVVAHNRGDGCCQSRLRDITLSVLDSSGETVFESPLLNPENTLGGGGTGGPQELTIDLAAALGGAVEGRFVQVARTPDPDLSGTGGVGGADEAGILSLGEVEVFEAEGGFGGALRTDLGDSLRGVNASAFVRVPFEARAPAEASLGGLRLRVWYDDGFVAYLNGREVARRSAPGAPGDAPAWDAQATAERPDAAAATPEEIDITGAIDALRDGANVLAIHGLNIAADDEDFIIQAELEAFSGGDGEWTRLYFRKPTPGGPNDANGVIDFVEDTQFTVDRGFFDSPIDVEITTPTPGAEIRYTLDRREPTASTGTVYAGPIRIDSTTCLRAAAFKPGYAPTDVDTETYIFLKDVLEQPTLLKDVVSHPVYGPQLKDSLRALPSLSIVTPSAINATNEVKTSVELILPAAGGGGGGEADGNGFQIDAGIKKVGGHSLSAYPKNNLRLYFRRPYGAAKLKYPLFKGLPFGATAAEEFDRLNLRAGHDSIFYLGVNAQPPSNAQYLRNRWMNDRQLEMGQPSTHGFFVHVYIGGTYWGVYELGEWASQDFLASYIGGEGENHAATNAGRPVGDSDPGAWPRVLASAAEYSSAGRMIDLANFADYMVLNYYAGNAWDWRPNQNWMAGGPVLPDSGGFKFFCWDSDIVLRRTDDYNIDQGGPGNLFPALIQHLEFRVLFADRIRKHLLDVGALTPERASASYRALADRLRDGIVAETARWRWEGIVWTRDRQWEAELGRLAGDFFPRRTGIVLGQLRAAGLYPAIEAPSFNRYGGLVEKGFGLTIEAPAGTVHFTLDGSDPRLSGGAVSPASRIFGGGAAGDPIPLVRSGAQARTFVPADGSLGLDWTEPGFDDSGWRSGATGVGFERGTGFESLIATDVSLEAFGKSASVYLRIPFEAEAAAIAGLSSLTLRMKYDDGFVAYLNGERVAAANAPDPPLWSSTAAAGHADNLAIAFQDFDISTSRGLLRAGRNVLAIHGLNLGASNEDFLILPELVGAAAGGGGAIIIDGAVTVKARAKAGTQWSALTEAFFWLDLPLRITEIMYHPRPAAGEGPFDSDAFEFLELANVGDSPLDLAGFRVTGGVRFDFSEAPAKTLRPGGTILIVEDLAAFAARYDVGALPIAGQYVGRLGNSGDALRLEGPQGEPILDFEYRDDWHPSTDGDGRSLVILDPRATPASWGQAASWAPSAEDDGSPGALESEVEDKGFQVPGDINQDGRLDISDPIALLGHLFLGSPATLPCGPSGIEGEGNRLLLDASGDGKVNLTDPVRILTYLFLSGAPPALGTGCMEIVGCPKVCAGAAQEGW